MALINGLDIHHEVQGDGPPVVFVHGLGATSNVWHAQRVTLSNRGSALGAYSVFTDLALGVAGPLGGWLVSGGRYGPLFATAAGFSVVAIALTAWLYLRYGRRIA